jgi:preprotein translocase subunit Sec63
MLILLKDHQISNLMIKWKVKLLMFLKKDTNLEKIIRFKVVIGHNLLEKSIKCNFKKKLKWRFYEILGIAKGADAASRKPIEKALEYHPDKILRQSGRKI